MAFRFKRSSTGTLSGESLITQLEDAMSGLGSASDTIAVVQELVDSAQTHSNNAQTWAEGDDGSVQALGGTHSAKVWAESIALPDITGQAGKFLYTDGMEMRWSNTTMALFGTPLAVTNGAIDVSQSTIFTLSVTQDTTLSITGVPTGMAGCISLIVTNGGSYTFTFPNSVKWADGTPPELSTIGTDVITLVTADGGVNWYATSILNLG